MKRAFPITTQQHNADRSQRAAAFSQKVNNFTITGADKIKRRLSEILRDM